MQVQMHVQVLEGLQMLYQMV
ncbi:hypothetical protein MTR67_027948 [Solanum verrucosum]|uniref:Uncharacterized protein n=1 Tax=Solanum verrucosum TaxID=315347 RepID=A0AAF0R5Q0_SOLVR|nr:hypothetical protein MTR67_027948 [Solanum verrucosum]